MANPRYQFLPWTRRGLAGEVETVDERNGAALPARARFGVSLTVSNVGDHGVDLQLFGPGDVIGVDPRLIVRVDPAPGSTDAEPNYCAAIEFDPPDFPWLFMPARADAEGRLRPWCVLVVVDTEVVAAPQLVRGAPLPTITVPPEAIATELPDLTESWAWGHAQLLTGSDDANAILTELKGAPDLNVSRLIAPRRLVAGRRYAACLVPAFEVGRLRGLGGIPAADAVLAPAWSDAAGADLTIPVYYHWEFATGPDGDFESLARELKPHEADPGSVGLEPMYIGHAAPDVPELDLPAAKQTMSMDAVLRAPKADTAVLGDVAPKFRKWLRETLEEPERRLNESGGEGTRLLGPPLYAGEAVQRYTVPDDAPDWFQELNLDPRARAAAGLGAQVVRANQEDFMRACWDQVGDVLAANELLSRGRLALEALKRIYDRHFDRLDPGRLTQLAAPLLDRVRGEVGVARREIALSSVPDAAVGGAMRRLTSAQSPLRKRIARRAGAAAERPRVLAMLAPGWRPVDPTDFIPDGIVSSRALEEAGAPAAGSEVRLAERGLALTLRADVIGELRAKFREVRPGAVVIGPRPDLDRTGLVTSDAIAGLVADRPVVDRTRLVRDALRDAAARPLGGEGRVGDLGRGLPRPGVRIDPRDLGGVALPERERPPFEIGPAVTRFETARVEAAAVLHLDAPTPEPRLVPLKLDALAKSVKDSTNPSITVPRRIRSMISASRSDVELERQPGLQVQPALDRVMVAPTIEAPLYRLLAAHDRDRFLPNADSIPPDSITLLETNPRFVAAFLAGANHEMNGELLWRRYPSDGRGTVLRSFWAWNDRQPDIAPVHAWKPVALAAQARGGPGGQLVLLLRGRLLTRYPNAVLYAWRADGTRLKQDPQLDVDLKGPVFAGRLDPDVSFAGFDLTEEMVLQGDGWFFIIQEQPTEPRFGFDESREGAAAVLPNAWVNAAWADTAVEPGGHIHLAGNPLANHALNGVRFGQNAAHLAAIMLQKPARVAIHASALFKEA